MRVPLVGDSQLAVLGPAGLWSAAAGPQPLATHCGEHWEQQPRLLLQVLLPLLLPPCCPLLLPPWAGLLLLVVDSPCIVLMQECAAMHQNHVAG